MKTATITLAVTSGVPIPQSDIPFSAQAGFRLTLTRNSTEATVSTPVEDKITWVIGNFIEGGAYTLLVEAVDSAGRVIQSLAPVTIDVPAAPTFTRVDTLSIAWS